MNLWGRLFGRTEQFDIQSLRPEEIRADEIALERQEERLDQEIEQCQKRIETITREVVEGGKKSRARAASRQILQFKERIADKEAMQATVSKSLIALGRLRRIVDASDQLIQGGVLSGLQGLSRPDLTRLLCGEMARSEAASKGLDAVIDLLAGPAAEVEPVATDAETEELIRQFERAIEEGDPTLVTAALNDEPVAKRREVLLEV